MRIVIEIDGEQVTAMVHDKGGAEETPSAELLKAAAALGAVSAGPAPREGEGARPGIVTLAPELREALRQPPLKAGEAPTEAKPSRVQKTTRGKKRGTR